MAGVKTYLENRDENNPTASIIVSGGAVEIGHHISFTESDEDLAIQFGAVTHVGPAASPGPPNITETTVEELGTGEPTGTYKYVITYVTAAGETLPSEPISIAVTSKKTKLKKIPVGVGNSGVTERKIYRTKTTKTASEALLLATLANNTTTEYEDNKKDSELGAAVPTSDTSSNATLVSIANSKFKWPKN